MFSPLSDEIWMKFGGQVRCVTRPNRFDFDEDLVQDPTTRIFKVILHHCEIGPKIIYSTISQKVVDSWHARTQSVLSVDGFEDLVQ